MRIIYYTWYENSKDDMLEMLQKMGHEVVLCDTVCHDYEQDGEVTGNLERLIEEKHTDMFFSFNFFPVVAGVAKRHKIKYISWIYDCPHWTLCSPAMRSEFNYIFVFDRLQCQQLEALGAAHCYHLPLAVNTTRLSHMLKKSDGDSEELEISFVGSLYENNLYDRVGYLPEYLRGYLSGIMEAQERIYGYNFVGELLTDEIVGQMSRFISMDIPQEYGVAKRELFASMLNGKITSQERIHLLQKLEPHFQITLYTASDTAKLPGVRSEGIVSYLTEMPRIFHNSKINLNISHRSIQSGIPLRALDIMGAGGFLLSNYQPELAEYFEDGKELVLYGSIQDAMDKAAFYLANEKERQKIADAGFRKIQELYSYEVKVKQIFEIAGIE